MKIIKTFIVTLIAVVAIGAVFLYREDILNKAASLTGADETTVTKTDDEPNEAESQGTSVTDELKNKVVKEIAETVVEQAINKYGGDASSDIGKVLDNVDEADKDKVTEIIADNLSIDAVGDVQSYISNNDIGGLMEYAQDKLTAEDYSELTGIFEKYSDSVADQINEAAD